MSLPSSVLELVERFSRNVDVYKRDDYKETRVRVEFIDPFFEALGWDVRNVKGWAEQYKDVVHEDALKVKGTTQAPDYCFRIGGTRKFFVEVKKPSVVIRDDVGPAYQLRRYAWSAKLPLSVLTDFEELAIYDCRLKPQPSDRAGVGRILYFTFDQYSERWSEIESILAKQAVLKGSFDQFVQETKGKRGTSEVDVEFLKEIEGWRDSLARNIALRNKSLNVHELNFAVQRTIDRIIFLRMCEDRGIEKYGRLLALVNNREIHSQLKDLYHQADEKYNAGLFDLQSDPLTAILQVDDRILKPILFGLYYPQCPYEFSVLPTEVLGQVYEQFLGKIIRLTPSHRAVVEEKSEVKKAGGVYYTPAYIVGYIVKETVGRLIEGNTPKQINRLHILDPACGSGSFLLGAYQFLLNYHIDWYLKNDPGKYARGKQPAIYQGPGGDWRLTTSEKKRILLNNIFGVDIDRQAVEVTKLSLLLKVLEGETDETLGQQLRLWHEPALPDLEDNIRCGNSLISTDFFSERLLPDESDLRLINPFNWTSEFPSIMATGGFDAVIGNPPYVRPHNIPQTTKEYLWKTYLAFVAKSDLYSCFMEKGLSLTKPGGYFSFIVPQSWTSLESFSNIRGHIISNSQVLQLTQLPSKVFTNATVETCIFLLKAIANPRYDHEITVEKLDEQGETFFVRKLSQQSIKDAYLNNFQLYSQESSQSILKKMQNLGRPLRDFISFVYGFKTADDAKFIHSSPIHEESKPFIRSASIQRYWNAPPDEYVWYVPEIMKANKSTARPGEEARFLEKKILVARMGKYLVATYDSGGLFVKDAMLLLSDDKKHNLLYLLGLINSQLLNFYYREYFITIDVLKNALLSLPIRPIDFGDPSDSTSYTTMISLVERMLSLHRKLESASISHEKSFYKRQIESVDDHIDSLVYKLYDLNENEIKIVEENQ